MVLISVIGDNACPRGCVFLFVSPIQQRRPMSRTPIRVSATIAFAIATVAGGLVSASTVAAAPAPNTRHIQKVGTGQFTPTGTGSGLPAPIATEIPKPFGPEASEGGGAAAARTAAQPAGVNRSLSPRNRAGKATGPATASGPAVAGGVVRNGPQLVTSFDGINHFQHRTANNGNQFSLEPPDQGLCVGGGHVVEAVNDAFRVYNADGTPQTGVIALNTLFGYPPAINRATGVSGPFVTDPSCLFDPTTKTFFLVILTLEQTPDGNFTGDNHLDL